MAAKEPARVPVHVAGTAADMPPSIRKGEVARSKG
eukprot:CAMPEP_0204043272 /NCGR_PEP_ID=MMETSP0360-20130528/101210_1 /ASSEMBLY_ACC=CAM_ASM_000342 /TAXON_ID=268821 /ORGANISM="Scrippsiella Hangoei, Strain SHTV-5" /LENGTH=34 /DNA_ID= /DNA_START= /DNA_END= /DNA_ORIENTATION=